MPYYARAGDIARMGPYDTYEEASQATIGLDGLPLSNAFVWFDDTPMNELTAMLKAEQKRKIDTEQSRQRTDAMFSIIKP